MPRDVFIIVSGKLTAASVNVKNALQIGKACMEAYENKLPQGFYYKISCYVVIMDTPTKGIDTGAGTTVDIEVVFNRTLGIIGYEEFDLHDKFVLSWAGTNSDITVLRWRQHDISLFKIKNK